ncbi:MAG TPA: PAS domain S-box protein [Turneriella sp.]|nr:PAS domain S-box protein [Turneriella sp.]
MTTLNALLFAEENTVEDILANTIHEAGFSFAMTHIEDEKQLHDALSQKWDFFFYTLSSGENKIPLSVVQEKIRALLLELPLILILVNPEQEHEDIRAVKEGASDYFFLDKPERCRAILWREVRNQKKVQVIEEDYDTQLLQLHLLKAAVENINTGLVITDARQAERPVVYLNKRFEEISGYSSIEILGQSLRVLYGSEKNQPGFIELQKRLSHFEGGEFYLHPYHKDGTRYSAREHISPIRNSEGRVQYFVIVHEDITKKKALEETLAEAWERTQLVLYASKMGYIDANLTNGKIYYSSRYADILGYKQYEMHQLKINWLDLVHEDDKAELAQQIHAATQFKSHVIDHECRFVRKDNSLVWVRLRGRIIEHDLAGNWQRYVGTILDISERRAQQERITDLTQKLMYVSEAELEKIASVLHDSVGQSLVLLKLNALQFLDRHQLRNEENIRALVDPITGVLEQVRHLSHSLTPIHMEQIGLDLVLEDMLDSASHLSGVQIQSRLSELVDFFPNNWSLEFYRIVQEIITNILKHAEATRIRINASRDEKNLIFFITDNGRPFDSTKVKNSFGMQMLNERIRHLNGKITFSAEKEGTTRTIVVPHRVLNGLRHV